MALARSWKLLLVLAAALILAISGTAEAGSGGQAANKHKRAPKFITRWFNTLRFKQGVNVTIKAEAVAFAVRKCRQHFIRASVGIDLRYGPALYKGVNMDVVTTIDFANYSAIQPFDKCIDANNPPNVTIASGLAGADDVALNLTASMYSPQQGCGFFPGCTGGITQLVAYNLTTPPAATSISEAVAKVTKDTIDLCSWDVSGADTTPFPPFLPMKHEYVTYQRFADVYQLRAYWAKLQGRPGPPLPSYAALAPLLHSKVTAQWRKFANVAGSDSL